MTMIMAMQRMTFLKSSPSVFAHGSTGGGGGGGCMSRYVLAIRTIGSGATSSTRLFASVGGTISHPTSIGLPSSIGRNNAVLAAGLVKDRQLCYGRQMFASYHRRRKKASNKRRNKKKAVSGDSSVHSLSRCPVVKKCPYIQKEDLLSEEEYETKFFELQTKLEGFISKLDEHDKQWLAFDLFQIASGKMSIKEIIGTINMVGIESDKDLIREISGWYRRTTLENFYPRFEKVVRQLSPHIKLKLLLGCDDLMKDYKSLDERIFEAKLNVLPRQTRDYYYSEQRSILSRRKFDGIGYGSGPSMMPTIWDTPSYNIRTSLHPTKDTIPQLLDTLQRGDVVSAIVYYNDGTTKFIGKRIIGLPGDHMKMNNGRMVEVPKNSVWIVGDNRNASYDSRHFGAIPIENLKCRIHFVFTLWPPRIRYLWKTTTHL